MSAASIFAPDAPKVWTIPAGVSFLDALADTLTDQTGLRENPAALADALIYVPNRRSARALALALYKASGEKPILPPDIRALGDLELDEPPSGAEEALVDLGPPLPGAKRLGALASLVMKFYDARDIDLPAIAAISAARELGRLLDTAALSHDVKWDILPDLVQDSDLASHWVESVRFLEIVTEAWPLWLKQEGATEPFERRLVVANAISAAVQAAPPKGPFIIAGSTGATPASRMLMKAAMQIPNGLVVLPGLDTQAPEQMWTEIIGQLTDDADDEPDHPQFSMAGTLRDLGLHAKDIPDWPGSSTSDTQLARRRLIHESLAPVSQTADWLDRLKEMAGGESESSFASKALTGLSLIEAEDEAQEAMIAALALREALETPGQTATLVTPDAGLARQVSAILQRWQIDLPPSGGVPLGRTSQGSLALLALEWVQDTGAPVALAALLKHPLVKADPSDVNLLETAYLRGARRWGDLNDLLISLPARTREANASRHTALPKNAEPVATRLLTRMQTLLSPADTLAEPTARISGEQAIQALIGLMNNLTESETRAWSGPAGEAASKWLESVSNVTADLPALTPAMLAEIFESLAANISVHSGATGHPRLNIWGPLEARLQAADRLILAGLNEGVWPDKPAADAFLPRRFRAPLGLPAPETRLGLAAHDFAQLACAPNVLMLYSARREDAPAVASRWLLRLQTLADGALGRDGAKQALSPPAETAFKDWANIIAKDELRTPPLNAKPHPCPPLSARPDALSVTRIDTLQRDPYTIYVSDILKLKKLEPLDTPLDARPRGTAIHAALEDFDAPETQPKTADHLHGIFIEKLSAAGEPDYLIAAMRAPLHEAATAYVAWWQARRDNIVQSWSEVRGELMLEAEGKPFKLTGVADRVEKHKDGTYTIIDFKTGDGKTRKQVLSGFEQQLPLLAAMARTGTIEGIPDGPIGGFGYVSVRFRFREDMIDRGAVDALELADASIETVTKLIAEYRKADSVYLSIPRVTVASKYTGDYDRLARRPEWARDTSDGEA